MIGTIPISYLIPVILIPDTDEIPMSYHSREARSILFSKITYR